MIIVTIIVSNIHQHGAWCTQLTATRAAACTHTIRLPHAYIHAVDNKNLIDNKESSNSETVEFYSGIYQNTACTGGKEVSFSASNSPELGLTSK